MSAFARRETHQISVGKVAVGGNAPISIQSMTITKTADVEGTLQQIYALAAAGCDIVRCTCNEPEAAEGLAQIVPRSPVPIIADIHHQYKMALAAMEAARRMQAIDDMDRRNSINPTNEDAPDSLDYLRGRQLPARPAERAVATARTVTRPTASPEVTEATRPGGILSAIFSGKDFQSANALASSDRERGYSAPVVQNDRINWGDPESSADFFRASKADLAKRESSGEGKAEGGQVDNKPTKEAILHKALEIIHHMIKNR
jgi:hypothetical protein